MSSLKIGIDLGGTKIEAIALEGETERLRQRIPVPRGDYDATIRAVAELVFDVEKELGKNGTVGVGIPGSISAATGMVKNANSTWLIGHALDRDLERALERPVRVTNDANCFALSEASDGAGRGAHIVFGVIIGTGTGGAIVVNGAVLEGRNRIAGEWGHNPLPWPQNGESPGPPCYCGRTGCIETFLSGTGLSACYASLSGRQIEAREVAQLAEAGDRSADRALEIYENRLARAVASIINVLDRTSSCWEVGCRTSAGCTSRCQRYGSLLYFRIPLKLGSSPLAMATLAVSEARHGCGRKRSSGFCSRFLVRGAQE